MALISQMIIHRSRGGIPRASFQLRLEKDLPDLIESSGLNAIQLKDALERALQEHTGDRSLRVQHLSRGSTNLLCNTQHLSIFTAGMTKDCPAGKALTFPFCGETIPAEVGFGTDSKELVWYQYPELLDDLSKQLLQQQTKEIAGLTQQETKTITSGAPVSSKAKAVLAILAEFSDCLLPEFTRYETTIPYGESDEEVPAEYLFWSDNRLSFALYVTDYDTQIVCDALPSCTFVEHKEARYAQKLKKFLSEPNLSGYFATTVPIPKPASAEKLRSNKNKNKKR
jgi:hypothetical protein